MAYRASAYCSSSDDETPSIQACSTTETSTFEITPCASASSVTEEQLKDHLLHMGQEGVCCCVSAEEITADQMDHPLVGWERRSIEGSKHSTWSQISFSEVSLSPAVDSTSQLYKPSACSEKSSRSTLSSRGAVSLGSEPKSQLRKYIHSALPDIPYIFRHHDVSDGDVSQYIEDYKCCYTYPGIEEKSRRVNIIHPSSSTTAVKPTLFVLGGDLTFQHKDILSCAGLRMRSDPLILHESPPHRRRTAPVPCSLGLTGSQVSSHSRHRELGVPRNSCSSPRSKSCQTEVIQVSGQSAIESHKRAIRARNLLQTSYAEIVKDGTKSIDVAAFVQADISLQSRSSSSLPTQQSTITRVTPQPGNSVSATPTQERRYQVKPSLFNTTLSIMQNMQSCHNSTVPAGSKKRVSGYNSPIRNHTCTAQRGKSKKKLSHETKIKSIS